MIKLFKRFIELLDVKDTDYLNKDGYVPKVNEALGKMELLPESGLVQDIEATVATDVNLFEVLSQSDYDGITTKKVNKLYFIKT